MFRIYDLPLLHGRIGMSAMPGRQGDYRDDLTVLLAWHPTLVLTLTSEIELEAAGAETLPEDLARAGVLWRHLPVCDFRAPSARSTLEWSAISIEAGAVVGVRGRVLAHCFGGCGRAGMALMRLMVEAGEAPDKALERLRAVRPCAVQSAAQEDWAAGRLSPEHSTAAE